MKMKKLFFIAVAVIAIQFAISNGANAQKTSGTNYTTGLGLFLDLGNGGTYVGPHVKHYFNEKDAGQIMVLFGNSTTIVGVEYSYNASIPNAGGLKWNAGVGPQVAFGGGL